MVLITLAGIHPSYILRTRFDIDVKALAEYDYNPEPSLQTTLRSKVVISPGAGGPHTLF